MSKFLVQIIILGGQLLSRAFVRAVREEIRASEEAARRAGSSSNTSNGANQTKSFLNSLTVEEAKKILDIKDDLMTNKNTQLLTDEIEKRTRFLIEINGAQKGNSAYLRAKISQAHDVLQNQIKSMNK